MTRKTRFLAAIAAIVCFALLQGCPKEKQTVESVSKSGNVIVTEPQPDAEISSPVTVKGRARVFEAALNARVVSEDGKELGKADFMASEGAPEFGKFDAKITFTRPPGDDKGFVEVFDYSAKDGSVIDLVRIPVQLK